MSTIDGHAGRIVASLDQVARAALAADPHAAVSKYFGLVIEPMDQPTLRGDGGQCDGMSFLDAGVIHYRPTAGRRENFTIAHELAHFLIEDDDPALDWLTSQPETGKLIEQLCDAVASRLLIPDEVIAAAGSTPSGSLLVELNDQTVASDHACVIRIADRLPCRGFVAVIDADAQAVIYASRSEGTRPYAWAGDQVPEGHVLATLDDGRSVACASWWPFPSGDHSDYYLSAHRRGRRTYAVFAEEDLWRAVTFHVPREQHDDTRPSQSLRCRCGYDGTFRGYPCPDCGEPFCPECNACGCTRRAERESLCDRCFRRFAKHLLDEHGHCEECR